jgi:hypothetical protein
VLQNGFDKAKQRGTHLAVDAESEADMLVWIQRNDEESTPTTRTEIRHYSSARFNKKATNGLVDSFIERLQTELLETTSTLHEEGEEEEPRLHVPRIFLHETIGAMNEAVYRHLSDSVCNLDEVGISEWEDRKSKRGVVPMIANGRTVHHSVARNLKHRPIVTCISAG